MVETDGVVSELLLLFSGTGTGSGSLIEGGRGRDDGLNLNVALRMAFWIVLYDKSIASLSSVFGICKFSIFCTQSFNLTYKSF